MNDIAVKIDYEYQGQHREFHHKSMPIDAAIRLAKIVQESKPLASLRFERSKTKDAK